RAVDPGGEPESGSEDLAFPVIRAGPAEERDAHRNHRLALGDRLPSESSRLEVEIEADEAADELDARDGDDDRHAGDQPSGRSPLPSHGRHHRAAGRSASSSTQLAPEVVEHVDPRDQAEKPVALADDHHQAAIKELENRL